MQEKARSVGRLRLNFKSISILFYVPENAQHGVRSNAQAE